MSSPHVSYTFCRYNNPELHGTVATTFQPDLQCTFMWPIFRSRWQILTIFLFLIPGIRAQQYLISTLAGAVPALTPSKALDASVIPALVASDGAGQYLFCYWLR